MEQNCYRGPWVAGFGVPSSKTGRMGQMFGFGEIRPQAPKDGANAFEWACDYGWGDCGRCTQWGCRAKQRHASYDTGVYAGNAQGVNTSKASARGYSNVA